MPTCKICKCEKPNREMASWGGTVTETCLECKAAKKAAKGAKEPAPDSASPAPSSPPADGLEIVVAASLGFAAKLDGESLVITQANHTRENDDDNISLTKVEAKALFAKYGDWATGK